MQSKLFLGRYEAIKLLGEGGMGKVYLARQTDLVRNVVVKVMHEHIANDLKFRDRFQRESLVMARFQHPYCVTLYDAAVNDPNGPCIVMEYVKGVNLETLLQKNGKFTAARVGRVIGQLCEVLQAAHDDGIIHRDLKPANLMVIDGDSPKERIKVMDFGLAKIASDGPTPAVTDTAVDFAVGTPGYIAPEQIRGESVDPRSDIYSVGCMMFELMAGRLPFVGATSMDVLLAHATEAPPKFADLGLDDWIPEPVENLVRMCLAKDPAHRPQSCRELGNRFAEALGLRPPRYSKTSTSGVLNVDAVRPTVSPIIPNAMPTGLLPESDIVPLQATVKPTVEYFSSPNPPSSVRLQSPAGEQTAVGTQTTSITKDAVPAVMGPPKDPNTLPFTMEAWMPQTIALMKLRGFVNDFGGEILNTNGGVVTMRLGRSRNNSGALTWLGLNRRGGPVDVELHFIRQDPRKENKHTIYVLFRPTQTALLGDKQWRERCASLFVDLRAYLMGG